MMQRIWATFYARCLEFLRDRATLGWNFVLPIALVLGLAFVFSGDGRALFKVAIVHGEETAQVLPAEPLHPFMGIEHVEFYPIAATQLEDTVRKVGRHQVDMLLDLQSVPPRYWVNSDSRNGYFLEQLLHSRGGVALDRQDVQGVEVGYVDWVVPGVLGMNMMFSCLFGVGFVIVRYRKSGYLKRLRATPLSATEFLLAQVLSRLLLVVFVTSVVFSSTNLLMDFTVVGSYWHLLLVVVLGAFSLISLSLVVSSWVSSEELAGGLLNFLIWPMMFLSGVWFSLEGMNPFVQGISLLSPLTHILTAARAIMLDGAGLAEISVHLGVLAFMSVLFLALGAAWFKWSVD